MQRIYSNIRTMGNFEEKHITLKDTLAAGASVYYSTSDITMFENVNIIPAVPAILDINIILLCNKGTLTLGINGSQQCVEEGDILICPSNTRIDNCSTSDGVKCKALCLTNSKLFFLLHDKMKLWNKAAYLNKIRVLKKDNNLISECSRYYYEILTAKLQISGYRLQADSIDYIIKAALTDLCELFFITCTDEDLSGESSKMIFNRFIDELSNNNEKRTSVNDYAGKLCITAKYLSSICKKESGKTASQWIKDSLDNEILHFLQNTNLSIKEVADKLGFPNMSSFGKYVRQHFNTSPKMLRSRKVYL